MDLKEREEERSGAIVELGEDLPIEKVMFHLIEEIISQAKNTFNRSAITMSTINA